MVYLLKMVIFHVYIYMYLCTIDVPSHLILWSSMDHGSHPTEIRAPWCGTPPCWRRSHRHSPFCKCLERNAPSLMRRQTSNWDILGIFDIPNWDKHCFAFGQSPFAKKNLSREPWDCPRPNISINAKVLLYDLSGSQSGPLWALNMCHCLLCRSHSLVNPPDQVISVISGQVSTWEGEHER